MKVLVLSDLHLEHGTSYTLPKGLEYDAVVLAGDIWTPGRLAVQWAQRESTFGFKPVLLVAGNHEFYGCEMARELDEMTKAAEGSNVHLLARSSVVIGGARFVGCTLWTDFQLAVRQANGLMETDIGRALAESNRGVTDFRVIEVNAPVKRHYREREFRRFLRAEDTLAMHWVDRDWLRRELSKPFDGPTVVITHHAPSDASVAAKYADDWTTPAFVSDLPPDFFERAAVWVHGHTHSHFDYQRGHCRVVSNPRGYRLMDSSFENHLFDAGFIVDVPRQETEREQDEAESASVSGVEAAALRDQYVHYGFEHYDALLLEGQRLRSERLQAADMVSVAEAATITGQSVEDIEAAVARGDSLGIADEAGSLRLPEWQFEPAYTAGIWKRLAEALGTADAWDLLAALETPLGALGGITPRVAIERGQSARLLEVIGCD